MQNRNYSRRAFLRASSYAGVTSASAAAMIGTLSKAAHATDYAFNGYRALICLFKFGGNDSFNMLAPLSINNTSTGGQTTNFTPHDEYVTRRSAAIAIPRSGTAAVTPENPALIPLTYNTANTFYASNPTTGTGVPERLNNWNFGLHPSMPNLAKLYNGTFFTAPVDTNRYAAFMANVGTLPEPISSYLIPTEKDKINKVLGIYSHSDQIAAWQTVRPEIRSNSGWAARLADIVNDGTAPLSNAVTNWDFFNLSLAGNDPVLMGGAARVQPYRLGANGPVIPNFLTPGEQSDAVYRQLAARESAYGHRMSKTLVGIQKRSLDDLEQYQAIMSLSSAATARANIDAAFNGISNPVADQLKTVAKLMVGRNATPFTARRQIFFVGVGGWDQHSNLKSDQADNLKMVDDAIGAFANAMKVVNLWSNVALFSCSDFGRTLASNGDGTDHAWGGNTFMIGGGVKGGMVYGKYPRLAQQVGTTPNPLDTGLGRLIPTTPVDCYMHELLQWFGINATDIRGTSATSPDRQTCVLPNRWNFPFGPTDTYDFLV